MSSRLAVVRGQPDDDGDGPVPIFALHGGLEMLPVASEMWRLVDGVRAQAIEDVLARVNARPGFELRFELEDCLDLAELLRGLPERLVAAGTIAPGTWAVAEEVGRTLAKTMPALVACRAASRPQDLLANGILVVRDLALLFGRAVDEHAEVAAI